MIDKGKLAVARARLITAMGRDVTWHEFSEICGVSPHTIVNLRHGHTGGSIRTLAAIVQALRLRGVAIIEEDLLATNFSAR